jgi:hypothetical protein
VREVIAKDPPQADQSQSIPTFNSCVR